MLIGAPTDAQWPALHTITVKDTGGEGTLWLDDTTPMKPRIKDGFLHIGCHRISFKAWKLIKDYMYRNIGSL